MSGGAQNKSTRRVSDRLFGPSSPENSGEDSSPSGDKTSDRDQSRPVESTAERQSKSNADGDTEAAGPSTKSSLTRGKVPEEEDRKRQRKCQVDLSKIEVVSFDLDDTLWDCEPVIRKAEADMRSFLLSKGQKAMHEQLSQPNLGRYQKAVLEQHPQKAHDVTFLRKTVIKLVANACNVEDETIAELAFEHFYNARTSHVSQHIFPGAVEALKRLKDLGLRIGTITNGNAVVPRIPEIAPFVEHHVNPELAGAAKPSKEPFEVLRQLFGDVPADRILHVGDSFETDVGGALNVGMKACWITSNPLQFENENVLVVPHVSDLADMFERDRAKSIESRSGKDSSWE